MIWTSICLELGPTPDFPHGSAARSYMLRLPLEADGRIDAQAWRRHPELATARRFWPNEADRHGLLSHGVDGWALAGRNGDAEGLFRPADDAVRPGGMLTLTSAAGETWPFIVRRMMAA